MQFLLLTGGAFSISLHVEQLQLSRLSGVAQLAEARPGTDDIRPSDSVSNVGGLARAPLEHGTRDICVMLTVFCSVT